MHTYLALGDSYTCGEAVPPADNFPHQLVARLRKQGNDIADPHIIAVTGWTTGELLQGITDAKPEGPYDLVTLLIGVNNQYRGEAKGFTLEGYRTEFVELLQTALHFAGNDPTHVIVVSIPDWGVMPFAEGQDRAHIAADINAYNAINKEESERAGVQYVDITPISRTAAQNPDLAASDGLHPSGKMYTAWTEAILPHVTLP